MPSASNSWAREKFASAILDLASASAPSLRIAEQSVATRLTSAACRAWSSRIAAWRAITCAISCASTEASSELVVGEREQAARDVELAVRQREGVDRRRVEDGDLVFQVRPLGGGDQPVDRLARSWPASRGSSIGAAIGREDAVVLALLAGGSGLACCGGGARQRGQRVAPAPAAAGRASASAAAQRCRSDSPQSDSRRASVIDRISLDLLGSVASIHGPPRSSMTPRTRTAGLQLFNVRPAAVNMRCVAARDDDGEIPRPAPSEIQ